MKKSFLSLSLMIPALISINEVSATTVSANVQAGSQPAMKEVKYDVPSNNDPEISNEVKRSFGTMRSEFPTSASEISPAQADALVAGAALQQMMNGEPSVFLSPEDELRLMQAQGLSSRP